MPTERTVDQFVLPYDSSATPYNQTDFDLEVIQFCEQQLFVANNNIQQKHHLRVAKCVVVGDIAVGKTCLINRFGYGVFSSNYKATIGVDFDVQNFVVNSIPFSLQLWDTAGQERFKCISTTYYRGAKVAIIVFDLSNVSTLLSAHRWLKELLDANSFNEKPLVFLVGAKKDLLCESAYHFVNKEAVKVANDLEAELWQVSAQTGENVNELFARIASLAFNTMLSNEIKEESNQMGVKEFGTFAIRKKEKNFIRISKKKKGERNKNYCIEMSCVIK